MKRLSSGVVVGLGILRCVENSTVAIHNESSLSYVVGKDELELEKLLSYHDLVIPVGVPSIHKLFL